MTTLNNVRRQPYRPLLIAMGTSFLALLGGSVADAGKPRVIIATDPIELDADYRFVDEDIHPSDPETGDPDDMQSLVRFLLYANEFRIEGIIASSERIEDDGSKTWVNRDHSIQRMLDKYDLVDENLRLHDPEYPTAKFLRSKIRKGFSCPTGQALPGPGKDNPGSDLIIEVVDASSEPLWFLDWVGQPQQFELSQALWKVRQERTAVQAAAFVSKIRAVYTAVSKGGPGGWLRDNFPDLFLIGTGYVVSGKIESPRSYLGMSEYATQDADPAIWNQAWADRHVRQGHGPLGAMFPSHTNHQKPGVSDYDSRTFFHLLPNGLSDPADPAMGNWGGRYYRVDGTNHWAPAQDDHPSSTDSDQRAYYTVGRYQHAMQAEFQARMDWCVRDFAHANHSPIAAVDGDTGKNVIRRAVRSGTPVDLRANGSRDPDGDALTCRWWLYQEAGSYDGAVHIKDSDKQHASLVAPHVDETTDIHLVLEVTDKGTPNLTSYRRLVLTVNPKAAAPVTAGVAAEPGGRPAVWVISDMTDKTLPGPGRYGTISDPDDISAMAAFLLFANEFDVRGITIASTSRKEVASAPDQAGWANDYLGEAYRADVDNLNATLGGYPEDITFLQASVKGFRFDSGDDYASLDPYPTVAALRDALREIDDPLYILCWGALSEAAILVKHCTTHGAEALLSRIRIVAHWTNSYLLNPGGNCNWDRHACEYLKEQAKRGVIRYYECGAIGETGIVRGAPVGDKYFMRFKSSNLGRIFAEGKFVHGKVDWSDAATYVTLMGTFGVDLSDLRPDGTSSKQIEQRNTDVLQANAKQLHDELLRRSQAAAGISGER